MHRSSGILLHPTSLPGRFGIGDLGREAYRFADFLKRSGQSLWQVLPLGPPGYGNSPYQSFSSMAGNPLLLSLEALAEDGWLEPRDLGSVPDFPPDRVAFGKVIPFKWNLLRKAAERFFESATAPQRSEYEEFCAGKSRWLVGFSEFMALKDANGGVSWVDWKRRSDPDPALAAAHKFLQFQFFKQWLALKAYCNARGVRIFGDIPIFVAHDSADVRANQEFFDLDEAGRPSTIAGVPPDYFSATGQCWGNPLYRWGRMEESGYRWWIERVGATLEMVDVVRIDHFRGFEKYYAIPGDATTAVNGAWEEGPGSRLFEALQRALGELPFVAEDLGFITPEVEELRDRWGFPGMRVLQFAFGSESPDDPFKPHNYVRNCVVYTGTHDNDTTAGWFSSRGPGSSTRTEEEAHADRRFALEYLGSDGREIHWDFIRAALGAVADTAIIPMQDILGLGSESRMNLPASVEGNWEWRLKSEWIDSGVEERLGRLTRIYGRSMRAL